MSYNYLVAGEVKAAYLFTPYVVNALMENPNLVAVFPSEGIGFGIDSIVVPANAPHPGNAHEFINFYLRADIAAISGRDAVVHQPESGRRRADRP